LQKNHLSGLKRKLLKLSFWNVQQLMEVRREVQPIIAKNKAKARTTQVSALGQGLGRDCGAVPDVIGQLILVSQ